MSNRQYTDVESVPNLSTKESTLLIKEAMNSLYELLLFIIIVDDAFFVSSRILYERLHTSIMILSYFIYII